MKIFIFLSHFFMLTINAKEKILLCKMNYGISGENDKTDIEFKNLSIIDQTQQFTLILRKMKLMLKAN